LTSATEAADLAGAETLAIMQAAPRYNRWQFRRIAPYLGRRVCEVGAGIGNMSALIAESGPEQLVLTDLDPAYRDILQSRFAGALNAAIEHLVLPDHSAASRYQRYQLDTVVALNVLEHISDDVEALRSMAGMLQRGGRAIVLVPAFQQLFGTLDRELKHVRRYTRQSLTQRMNQAGFRVERAFYFNLVGTLGWWVNARIRNVPRIPIKQLRIFDAMVPILQLEDLVPLPFGQSVIGVGSVGG
jgi:2-polyprenyl-3-methyl-5-hydroxy-6-metoxy-1,4-benzoquinol methylase